MSDADLRTDLRTILSMLAEGGIRFNEADRLRKDMDSKLDALSLTLNAHLTEEMSSLRRYAPTKIDQAFKGGVLVLAACLAMLVGWNFQQDADISSVRVGVNTVQNRIESVVEMQQVTVHVLASMRNQK